MNFLKSFIKLIQIMENDAIINEKVTEMLQLESYERRSVLNDWLKQLRNRHASENLLNALSCLFNDKTAAEVLFLINK